MQYGLRPENNERLFTTSPDYVVAKERFACSFNARQAVQMCTLRHYQIKLNPDRMEALLDDFHSSLGDGMLSVF